MTTQRIREAGRAGIAGLVVAAAMAPAAVEAQQAVQAQVPAPAPSVIYAPPQPAELFASNLGIYYRLEPYGASQGARLSRPPVPGAAAGQIQLEPGDLIIALDNLPINGPDDVLNHWGQTSVQFVNIRTGRPQTNWITIPSTTPPPPPGGGTPPTYPPYPPYPPTPTPPGTLPYSLGVATVLAPIEDNQVYAAPAPGQPTAPRLALRPTYGLRVTQVVPGSAAQRVGLEVGDVIVTANGMPMSDANALRRAISASTGALNLVIRDVRVPGREVPVYVPLDPTGGQVYASPAPPQ